MCELKVFIRGFNIQADLQPLSASLIGSLEL